MLSQAIRFMRERLGFIIIALAFCASAFVVYINQSGDEERYYTVQAGDTLAAIASGHQTTVEAIVNENYPDISEKDIPAPGVKMRLPRRARSRTITVRIAHWQLEPGFRDGIDLLAKEYRKLHPNVRVIQIGVPYNTYGQWFSTQMVGGTPPDLIQIGYVPYNLLISYFMRYFTPLTEYINAPNPYNAGNEFRGMTLRDTTKDGLRACYYPDLQEYMTVGVTMHLTRMVYNKTLLKKFTGTDVPPATFGEFISACEKIKKNKYANAGLQKELAAAAARVRSAETAFAALNISDTQRYTAASNDLHRAREAYTAVESRCTPYVPIANSSFHMAHILENNFFQPITSKAREIIDFNHDCGISAVEQYIGIKSGLITLDHPSYRAKFAMVTAVGSNSSSGFTGLNRDDAVLLFIQERAVFIPSWTGDVNILVEQGRDNGFEIGVFDFPFPGPRDSVYAAFEGPGYENAVSGTWFGCDTPDSDPERKRAAIDFLLFVLSKDNNIKLNRMTGWIPCVKGAPGEGMLSAITPHVDGVTPGLNLNIGGESIIKWSQLYALLQIGEISFDKLRDEFTPFYLARGYKDYLSVSKDYRRSIINDEKISGVQRAKVFLSAGGTSRNEQMIKYRYTLLRAVTREMDMSHERDLVAKVDGGDIARKAYEYGQQARSSLGR